MARTRRDSRRTGLYPLAYMGVEPIAPPLLLTDNRAPTPEDRRNFDIGTIWIDRSTAPLEDIWMLVNLDGNVARWLRISQAASTALETLTGNIGLAVPGDGANNINVIGAGPYVITGNPATNTLTLTDNGTIARQYDGDVGSAFPIANVLNIWGGTNINTTGAGQTITVNLDNDVVIPGTLTLPLLGAGVVQTTAGGLFFSNNGANGQVIIGGGAAPAWANITSAGGTIVVTNGPNSINIDTAAGGVVLPGDNININPANTVNLNETIHWPRTNAAGTQGMIYLDGAGGVGGARFLHNYSPTYGSVFLGRWAGNLTNTGDENIGIGYYAMDALTSGDYNTAVGTRSMTDLTSGLRNTAYGAYALDNETSGDDNVAIGYAALTDQATVNGNTAVGAYSMSNITTGGENTAVGFKTMQAATTAQINDSFGYENMLNLTTGERNSSMGEQALRAATTASRNVAIGNGSLIQLQTGEGNICVGINSGYNYTTNESNNIIITNSNVSGVVGESNVIRIGTHGTGPGRVQEACYIAGIYNKPYDGATDVDVRIDANSKLGTYASAKKHKDNIQDMGEASSPIFNLRPVTFHFKNDDRKLQCFGLIAEEVDEVMPRLVAHDPETGDPVTVRYHALVPMLLNEIQKLTKRVEELEKKI